MFVISISITFKSHFTSAAIGLGYKNDLHRKIYVHQKHINFKGDMTKAVIIEILKINYDTNYASTETTWANPSILENKKSYPICKIKSEALSFGLLNLWDSNYSKIRVKLHEIASKNHKEKLNFF